MSDPSNWPLSAAARRITVADSLRAALQAHPLCQNLYITAVGFYPQARLHEMRRKDHDDYILMYCAEGKGLLSYAQRDWEINAGDVFILPPQHPHRYQADNDHPWTLYWCHFQGRESAAFFQYIYPPGETDLVLRLNDMDFLYGFKDLLQSAQADSQLAPLVYASNLLRPLLTRIERQRRDKQHRQLAKKDVQDSLQQAQAFMRAHLNKQLSLDELARLCACSKFHFSRQYQQYTGKTPLRHFSEMKLEHACFLLEQTTMRVSEIAFQLGYDDALYFSRVFRKVYGQAPSVYRKSLLVPH